MAQPTDPAAEHRRFVDATTAALDPLFRAVAIASWELSTSGSSAAAEALADASVAREEVLADPALAATADRLAASPCGDEILDRSVTVIRLLTLPRRGDRGRRADIARREADLRRAFGVFRPELAGKPASAAELDAILATSTDSSERRAAWEASKAVGAAVREPILELVELRNAAAIEAGFRDHYALSLAAQELDEEQLLATLTRLEKATRTPFRTRKAALDAERATRLGVAADALQPWHYEDAFFQRVSAPSALDLEARFADLDLPDVAARFFDGLGLDVRGVLAASDLEPREGKNPHAFCTDLDRRGDVRVLCNLVGSERWMSTLLHELGHAAFDRYIDQPWMLHRPAHTLVTEAVAMLMGRQTLEPEFLVEYAEVPAADVAALGPGLRRHHAFRMQLFVRWALVMVHFERELYAAPRRDDLDELWWTLVEKYQLIPKPEGRNAPDWAAKIHFAIAPVYYHNYVYGELLASQLRARIAEDSRTPSLVDNVWAGESLILGVFRPGASLRWDRLVERATGTPLDAAHFVREFAS
ncbi:MAG: M2 family metallopeptidase [Myxococcales bacterium]|nr:M2 family metallopeptidase [Myxococcales bacterium]MCB9530355.1 M2 family metallopeptidase [Myxococcales bacterium]